MPTLRLDKLLSHTGFGSRMQVKDLLKKSKVLINGVACKDCSMQIDSARDQIIVNGQAVHYQEHYYVMMHKPAGLLTAARDPKCATVVDLIPLAMRKSHVMPVGRLDKDTTGLLLLTNDGDLAHRLLAPKNTIWKEYLAQVDTAPIKNAEDLFKTGMDLGDFITLPASMRRLSDFEVCVTVCEGKFHQVKRMLQKVGSQVLKLKRVSFAGLMLDDKIQPGQFRQLTDAEIQCLNQSLENHS